MSPEGFDCGRCVESVLDHGDASLVAIDGDDGILPLPFSATISALVPDAYGSARRRASDSCGSLSNVRLAEVVALDFEKT